MKDLKLNKMIVFEGTFNTSIIKNATYGQHHTNGKIFQNVSPSNSSQQVNF